VPVRQAKGRISSIALPGGRRKTLKTTRAKSKDGEKRARKSKSEGKGRKAEIE
jgi:hypothetical protein